MNERLTLEFDGGSRGNPGPAGIGVVIRAEDNTPVYTLGRCIGRATNNVAEYRALITAMEKALELGARRIIIRGDSELIIKQMTGVYRVKHPDMRTLYVEAQTLFHKFDEATITHNLRHKNELADKLVNLALDRKRDVTDVDETVGPSPLDEPSPVSPNPGDRFICRRCGCEVELRKASSLRPHQLKPFVCQCGGKMDEGG
ncbi:MAG TPA: ribonuclease HI family protein [Tepidisphaeraceae bacterium]|jgi:ribonuclease HI|nr:ribonuclease HI family protein [Tepidisphaeraceae bacterium]